MSISSSDRFNTMIRGKVRGMNPSKPDAFSPLNFVIRGTDKRQMNDDGLARDTKKFQKGLMDTISSMGDAINKNFNALITATGVSEIKGSVQQSGTDLDDYAYEIRKSWGLSSKEWNSLFSDMAQQTRDLNTQFGKGIFNFKDLLEGVQEAAEIGVSGMSNLKAVGSQLAQWQKVVGDLSSSDMEFVGRVTKLSGLGASRNIMNMITKLDKDKNLAVTPQQLAASMNDNLGAMYSIQRRGGANVNKTAENILAGSAAANDAYLGEQYDKILKQVLNVAQEGVASEDYQNLAMIGGSSGFDINKIMAMTKSGQAGDATRIIMESITKSVATQTPEIQKKMSEAFSLETGEVESMADYMKFYDQSLAMAKKDAAYKGDTIKDYTGKSTTQMESLTNVLSTTPIMEWWHKMTMDLDIGKSPTALLAGGGLLTTLFGGLKDRISGKYSGGEGGGLLSKLKGSAKSGGGAINPNEVNEMLRVASGGEGVAGGARAGGLLSKLGGFGKVGKALGPLGLLLGAGSIGYNLYNKDYKGAAKSGGGLLGGILGGAAAGAGAGALGLNPFTIAAGTIVGGVAGAIGGEKAVGWMYDKLGGMKDKVGEIKDSWNKFWDKAGDTPGEKIGYIARLATDKIGELGTNLGNFVTVSLPNAISSWGTSVGNSLNTFFYTTIPSYYDQLTKSASDTADDIVEGIKKVFTVKFWKETVFGGIASAYSDLKGGVKSAVDWVMSFWDDVKKGWSNGGKGGGPYYAPNAGGPFTMTSGFGNRIDPKNGGMAWHSGVDYGVPTGTKIAANISGTVTNAGPRGDYGNMVEVTDSAGNKFRFAHLSSTAVSVGQMVSAGQLLGLSGSTGRSTGPHLHFEVAQGGKAVNPSPWLSALLLGGGVAGSAGDYSFFGGFFGAVKAVMDAHGVPPSVWWPIIRCEDPSLDPRAHNNNASTGDDSYGLFQINLLGSLRKRLQTYGLSGPEALFDPATNAGIAADMIAGVYKTGVSKGLSGAALAAYVWRYGIRPAWTSGHDAKITKAYNEFMSKSSGLDMSGAFADGSITGAVANQYASLLGSLTPEDMAMVSAYYGALFNRTNFSQFMTQSGQQRLLMNSVSGRSRMANASDYSNLMSTNLSSVSADSAINQAYSAGKNYSVASLTGSTSSYLSSLSGSMKIDSNGLGVKTFTDSLNQVRGIFGGGPYIKAMGGPSASDLFQQIAEAQMVWKMANADGTKLGQQAMTEAHEKAEAARKILRGMGISQAQEEAAVAVLRNRMEQATYEGNMATVAYDESNLSSMSEDEILSRASRLVGVPSVSQLSSTLSMLGMGGPDTGSKDVVDAVMYMTYKTGEKLEELKSDADAAKALKGKYAGKDRNHVKFANF